MTSVNNTSHDDEISDLELLDGSRAVEETLLPNDGWLNGYTQVALELPATMLVSNRTEEWLHR